MQLISTDVWAIITGLHKSTLGGYRHPSLMYTMMGAELKVQEFTAARTGTTLGPSRTA